MRVNSSHRELVAAVVELRRRAGLTQRQLADAVGREQSYIRDSMRRRTVPPMGPIADVQQNRAIIGTACR